MMKRLADSSRMLGAAGGAGGRGGIGGNLGNLSGVARQLREVDGAARQGGGGLNFFQSVMATMIGGSGAILFVNGLRNAFQSLTSTIADGVGAVEAYQSIIFSLRSLQATELVNLGEFDSLNAAMPQATENAKELFAWIEKLAIESPFSQQGAAQAFRLAQAYGFTTQEAQALTQATVDFTAATGQSEAVQRRIVLAMGQISAAGRLMGQDILQLVNTGVPVLQILADAFDTTTAEVKSMTTAGLIPAEAALGALTNYMQNNFGGAAKSMQNTVAGLKNSLGDLREIILRELFQPLIETVAIPFGSMLVSQLQTPEFRERIQSMGQAVADFATRALERLSAFAGGASAIVDTFVSPWLSGLSTLVGYVGESVSAIVETFASGLDAVAGYGANIVTSFADGIIGAVNVVAEALTAIGNVVTYWLQPGSPPRLLPDLDIWGKGAADAYLEGWTQADFKMLDELSSAIEGALKNIDATVDEADIAKIRDGVAQAIGSFKITGEFDSSAFTDLVTRAGELEPYAEEIGRIGEAFFNAASASAALGKSEAELLRIQQQLQGLDRAADATELQRIIENQFATDEQRRRAQLQLAEMQATKDVENATAEEKAAKDALSLYQARFDEQFQFLDLYKQIEVAANKASSAAGKIGRAKSAKGLSAIKSLAEGLQGTFDKLSQPLELKTFESLDALKEANPLQSFIDSFDTAKANVQASIDGFLAPFREMVDFFQAGLSGVDLAFTDELTAFQSFAFRLGVAALGVGIAFNSMVAQIDTVVPGFQSAVDEIGRIIGSIGDAISSGLQGTSTTNPITGDIIQLEPGSIRAAFAGVRRVINEEGAKVKDAISAAVTSFLASPETGEVTWTSVATKLQELVDGLLPDFSAIQETIDAELASLFTADSGTGDTGIVGKVQAQLDLIFGTATFDVAAIGTALQDAIADFPWTLAAAAGAIALALTTGLGSTVWGVVGVAGAIASALAAAVWSVGGVIATMTSALAAGTWTVSGIIGSLTTSLSAGLTAAALSGVAATLVGGVGLAILAVVAGGAFVTVGQNIVDAISDAVTTGDYSTLATDIQSIIAGALRFDGLRNDEGEFTADSFTGGMQKAFDDAVVELTTFANNLIGEIATVINAIDFAAAGFAIGAFTVQMAAAIASAIANINWAEVFSTTFDAASSFILGLTGGVVSGIATIDWVDLLKDSFTALGGAVLGAIEGIVNGAVDSVNKILPGFAQLDRADLTGGTAEITPELNAAEYEAALAGLVSRPVAVPMTADTTDLESVLASPSEPTTAAAILGGNKLGKFAAEGASEGFVAGLTGEDNVFSKAWDSWFASGKEELEAQSPSQRAARDWGVPVGEGIIVGVAEALGGGDFGAAFAGAFAIVETFTADSLDLAIDWRESLIDEYEELPGESTGIFDNMTGTIYGYFQSMVDKAIAAVIHMKTSILALFRQLAAGVTDAIRDLRDAVILEFENLLTDLNSQENREKWHAGGREIGGSIVDGLVSGIEANRQAFIDAAVKLVNDGLDAAKDAAEIESPSKRAAREIGEPISEGVAVGVAAKARAVRSAMADTINGVLAEGRRTTNGIGEIRRLNQSANTRTGGQGSPTIALAGDTIAAIAAAIEKAVVAGLERFGGFLGIAQADAPGATGVTIQISNIALLTDSLSESFTRGVRQMIQAFQDDLADSIGGALAPVIGVFSGTLIRGLSGLSTIDNTLSSVGSSIAVATGELTTATERLIAALDARGNDDDDDGLPIGGGPTLVTSSALRAASRSLGSTVASTAASGATVINTSGDTVMNVTVRENQLPKVARNFAVGNLMFARN